MLKGAAGNKDVLLREFCEPDDFSSSKLIQTGNADTLLSPITLGCKTKTPKIIGIAITALQRLVALGAVPTVNYLPSLCRFDSAD